MASVYKRSCDKGNRRSIWYFSYKDENGTRRQKIGFSDKEATEKLARKLEDDARLILAGLKQGALSPNESTIDFQLSLYKKHLNQRDVSQAQVDTVAMKVKKIVEGTKIETICGIDAQKVEYYLAKRRETGLSKQTSNQYRQAIHQFCRWLCRNSRLNSNPIAEIPKLNILTDRRHDRRALTSEEFQRLVEAAETGPPVETIDGIDRAMMYILAAWTGYRRGEIASLTLSSFHLDSNPATLTVEAKSSKRRKQEIQVLHVEVIERFRNWLKVRTPKHDRFLFPISKEACGFERKTAKMMRKDLQSARDTWIEEAKTEGELENRRRSSFLLYEDDSGLFADFHPNRHTFITNLARAGISPKVAQTLARHSDIRLTMNVYTHTDMADRAEAVAKLLGMKTTKLCDRLEMGGSTIDGVNGPKIVIQASSDQRHSSTSTAEHGTLGQS